MTLRLEPLGGHFGVQVDDVDVSSISDRELRQLLHALYDQRVLVLRTGGLSQAQYVAFARRIGDPIRLSSDEQFPEIGSINNIDTDTRKDKTGAAHWHTDQSFTEKLSSATMLYSVQAPVEGGETLFCDMAAAYADLPEACREEIDDLVVEHRHGVSVAARPGDHTPIPPRGWDQSTTVYHRLVRRHPVTGQKTLYAITGTSQGIKGMGQADAESLLNRLCEHAFQDRFITRHAHRVHDLVMWDNPTTMHRATPIAAATGPADTRLIHRISLRGRA